MSKIQAKEERIVLITHQMGRWADQVLGRAFHGPSEAWKPAINVYESDSEYTVVAELAGVEPGKIDLRVERGTLTIAGRRHTPVQPQGKKPIHLIMMEIDHGSFCRTLKLPNDADVDNITASYGGGYLWVRLPKKATSHQPPATR